MFRYSGSKKRLLKFLPPPPTGISQIVEPFAGSAAYGVHYRPSRLSLCEANTDVVSLWNWLISEATEEDVRSLQALLAAKKAEGKKFKLSELGLSKGPETLARLTTSGVYVGQLSSWVFYPQHTANFSELIAGLPYIKESVRVIGLDFEKMLEADVRNTLFFIDPPYVGTSANYIDKSNKGELEKSDLRQRIVDCIQSVKAPVLFTYGDGAPEVFPEFDWQLAVQRRVPKIRTGGTKLRSEYFAKIRF